MHRLYYVCFRHSLEGLNSNHADYIKAVVFDYLVTIKKGNNRAISRS